MTFNDQAAEYLTKFLSKIKNFESLQMSKS